MDRWLLPALGDSAVTALGRSRPHVIFPLKSEVFALSVMSVTSHCDVGHIPNERLVVCVKL